MPALLIGLARGAAVAIAWFFAEKTIEAGVQGVKETGNVMNGPALQLAGIAAVVYAAALLMREKHKGSR